MKYILFVILLILPFLITTSIYSLDKAYFLCPIEYKSDIAIRFDCGGNGLFASPRSGRRIHRGIDLLADIGTPVLAVRSGIVLAATRNNGMGKYVIIRHTGNIITIYGHLSGISTRKGALVRQGQIIGAVGKTGNARSNAILPHLHFEIRKDGIPQDPLNYL